MKHSGIQAIKTEEEKNHILNERMLKGNNATKPALFLKVFMEPILF